MLILNFIELHHLTYVRLKNTKTLRIPYSHRQFIPGSCRSIQERATRKLGSHSGKLQLSVTCRSSGTAGYLGAVRQESADRHGSIRIVREFVHNMHIVLCYKWLYFEPSELLKSRRHYLDT